MPKKTNYSDHSVSRISHKERKTVIALKRRLSIAPNKKVQAVIKANRIMSKSKITVLKSTYKC